MNLTQRSTFIVAACLWATASITVSYTLRQHSLPTRIGSEILLAEAGLGLWIWSRRKNHDPIMGLTWFGIVMGVTMISSWITGDWASILIGVWYIWVVREYIIDAADRERQIRARCVHATGLTGTVEYDSMHFSGVLVEECSSDWTKQFSQVKTDASGGFALPHASDGPVHYIRVSWPGTRAVHLRVETFADAQPLLVRLKPQKPKRMGDWGR